tara:strand:- start:1172 stop:2146 length:975 start_codon:yes stop_codon:yes gene_type:complete
MTFVSRLKGSAAHIARVAAGTALGLGLTVSLLATPGYAFAQDVAAPAVAPAVIPAEGKGPALWVVRDADSTIYLFGTVHVLRADTAWGSPTVDAAFDSASRLILEVTNPDDQAAAMPLIQQYGISPQTPLSSLLTPEELAQLDTVARSMGMTAAQLDPMRPWLVALTIGVAPLVKAGYDPQSGVELILRPRALAAGKAFSGLETIDEQLRILALLPEADQLSFLRSALDDYQDPAAELETMVAAWARGDVDTINEVMVKEMREEDPVIYDAMLTNRNINWAGQIETLLEGSGTVFIAVGAAHLAGDDSVQAQLAHRGITTERIN